MEDMLTTREAAHELGVGPTTVKRWADEGLLETGRTAGGHRRYTRQSVERLARREYVDVGGALHERLASMSPVELDLIDEGVIGFDDDCRVTVYNRAESSFAGVARVDAIGKHLFGELAPCTNNRLIYGRVSAGLARGQLDFATDYTFSYRMKPTNVHLHFFRDGLSGTNWLIVRQRAAPASAPATGLSL